MLRKLTEVVKEAMARPESQERPKVQRARRPGWAEPLVLSVLEAASEPMTAMEIVREIEQRFKQKAVHATVTYVLRRSRAVRLGLIERVEPARYVAKRTTS